MPVRGHSRITLSVIAMQSGWGGGGKAKTLTTTYHPFNARSAAPCNLNGVVLVWRHIIRLSFSKKAIKNKSLVLVVN